MSIAAATPTELDSLRSALAPLSVRARRGGMLRLSLRARLLAIALLGFVASLAIAALSLAQLHTSGTSAAQALAIHMAGTLAHQFEYLEASHPAGSSESARDAAQGLVKFLYQTEGREVALVDGDLRLMAATDIREVGRQLQRNAAVVAAATIADSRARVFVEPAVGGTPRNLVVVAVPRSSSHGTRALIFDYTSLLNEMSAAAASGGTDLLLVAVPMAAVLVLMALMGSRKFGQSIRRLHSATVALAKGRPVERIGIYGNDELGDLARAFDRMRENLVATEAALRWEVDERRAAQAEVQAAHDALEERVRERTGMLLESNQRLDAELAERQRIERQLERMARFDPLTGLPNRGLFVSRLEQAMRRSEMSGRQTVLMFVDLDRFKSINDSLGHEVGDGVLLEAAQRMQSLLRKQDTVSRIGGDEFTVILEDLDGPCEITQLASRLVEGFRLPLKVNGLELFVTLSVGIAVSSGLKEPVDELMKQADFAMYHAKAQGRNGFQFHSEELGAAARRRLAIERALSHAIDRDEFSLHYQVRVSARTNRPVGMEALLRWNSAELGPVSPMDFIPVAEDSGLILAIGEWVLRHACEQHTRWRLEGLHPGVIGINVSARQFRQPDFVELVARIARETGIDARDVELEVTESMLMSDPDHATRMMASLRELGFGIAIDDFGTGYSSLSHLKRFPATKIKIDRAFVNEIDTNADDAAIAAAIVALASTLSLQVTAEGIETEGQLAELARLKCDEYQGYLFSRPLASANMREVLEQGLTPGTLDVPAGATNARANPVIALRRA